MKRLELEDAYRSEFESVVVGAEPEPDGGWIELRESLFYPTSGGQPHDLGTLRHASGEARVVDVQLVDGAVRHRVEGAMPAEGTPVAGAIDVARRYRHMQRHSAQHLLSAAFLWVDRRFETRSVSLTSPDAELDLAGEPDGAAQADAFDIARAWAYEDLAIDAFEVDEGELEAYPLRRPPKVSGRVRLVRMGEVELAACGGTHLRGTAEMLPLLRMGEQRVRGGLVRVVFRAGREASDLAQEELDRVQALAREFSSRSDELPERVRALREDLAVAHRRLAERGAELARMRAARLLEEAERAGGARMAHGCVDDEGDLEPLAEALASHGDVVAVLAAAQGDRVRLMVTRGASVELDVRPALQAGLAPLEGRGGGRPERAQGAGTARERVDDALAAAMAEVRGALNASR